MSKPRERKTRDERATELGCQPELVPVIERLDLLIALLTRMPVTYNRYVVPMADQLLRDFFPDYRSPID